MGTRARIVFLVSTLRRSGPTTQLLNILRHLDAGRFDAVVVTISPEPADTMRAEFDAAGVRVRSLGLSRAGAFLMRRWRGAIGAAAGAPLGAGCLVHSQGVRADVVSARALGGIARVATARNDPREDYVMKFGALPGRWMARAQLRAFARLPAVVACSATLADALRGCGVAAEVIRNGVDTARFRPADAAARAAARSELALAPDARVGVCVGSLVRRKNPLGLVAALRRVDAPGLVIAFVGGGELEAPCREAAAGDPRIRFAGAVDDVRPWLDAADFLVSPSRSEGLPNSVLEALAAGLPVLLSDIPPHRELQALAPKAVRLFPVDDVAALAEALGRAAAGGAGAGLAAGKAAPLFGAEATSRAYQQLYLRLLAGTR